MKLSSSNSLALLAAIERRFTRPNLAAGTRATLESTRVFLVSVSVLLGLLILWAGLARVDQVVRVEGKIVPAGKSQQIQHLEGGIVESINVVEGQVVSRGDLLLTIDPTAAGSNLNETTAKITALRLRIARLEAETKAEAELSFPPDIAMTPEAEAERKLSADKRSKLQREIAVHEQTIKQTTADVNEAEQRLKQLDAEIKTARERSQMLERMGERGAASRLEILDAQGRTQRLATEIAQVTGTIPRFKAAADVERSRISAIRQEFSTLAQNDLVAAMDELQRLRQIGKAGEDRLKRTEVRAPIAGTINRVNVNTVGGVVKPGETLVDLIPTTSEVLIDARANPRDRGYLRRGLDAEIRITAYDTGELGMLSGKVTDVGADSVSDPRGESYYRVNILVSTDAPRYVGKSIIPGMTVSADIVTGRRALLSYLLSPLGKFSHNMFRDAR